jgi:hypothetical protein
MTAAVMMVFMNLSHRPHKHRRGVTKLGLRLTTTLSKRSGLLLAETLLVVVVGGFRRCSLDDEARIEN